MTAKDKTRIQITISAEMRERLDAICAEVGITKSAAAAIALNEWMKRVSTEREMSR